MNLHVDRICRTCLSEKNCLDLRSLYESTLKYELFELTSIKIEENDGLPSGICSQCLSTLNIIRRFKNQCQQSENHLKSILLSDLPQIIYKTVAILNNTFDDTGQEEICTKKTAPQSIELSTSVSQIECNEFDTFNNLENVSNSVLKEHENGGVIRYNPKISSSSTENVNNQNYYECPECKKQFRFESILKYHMVRHGQKLKCEICCHEFNVIKTYTQHMKSKHPDIRPHKCKQCGKYFSAVSALKKHIRIHVGERKHLCNVCGKRFFELNLLLIHSRIHTGEKPLSCGTCGKKFRSRHGLRTHNKIHTGERKHQCNMCGRRFTHSFVLTVHKRIHTGEKPFKCNVCDTSFKSSSYFKIHQRIHSQEKPYKCEKCAKAFVCKSGLVSHQKVHSGEKLFQCSVCGKTAKRYSDLLIHMRSHSGERPFACNQCDKRYVTSSNLAAHKRTHLGIKSYVCSTCGKAFGDPRTLKSHYRIHTGEKPYVCTICGNSYSQSGQLSVHRRIHKSNERGHTKM